MIQNAITTLINIGGKLLYTEFYREYKNRPAIVFLHDNLGCVALWKDFPKKVGQAAWCNVLVYDRLRYGRSPPMPGYERPLN